MTIKLTQNELFELARAKTTIDQILAGCYTGSGEQPTRGPDRSCYNCSSACTTSCQGDCSGECSTSCKSTCSKGCDTTVSNQH